MNELSLLEYIRNAKAIVQSPSYANSKMMLVDEFAVSPRVFFENHEQELNRVKSLETAFLALVAPPLEGKTQTAFTLQSVNPHYFIMSAGKRPSQICLTFLKHGLFLRDLAHLDLSRLGHPELNRISSPSTAQLLSNYCDKPLAVLGFFREVIEQGIAARRKSPENFNWMYFYARQLKPFKCWQVTINEFKDLLSGWKNEVRCASYCVFLDDFTVSCWTIFVRNLARAVGLSCIVSNTQAEIADLVWKSDDRSTEPNCWCLELQRQRSELCRS